MGFRIIDDYEVFIFGKQMNSLQHIGLIFAYLFFISFIWPLISGSSLIAPFFVCVLGLVFPEFIYQEIIPSGKLFKTLGYLGVFITTLLYTSAFLESPFVMKLLHYAVYFIFVYIYTKKADARPIK